MSEYILKIELKNINFQPLNLIDEITSVCRPAIIATKCHFDMKICEIFHYFINLL